MDCEGIQSSKLHSCIRAMYILKQDETDELYNEFIPCREFNKLESKYKNAFRYCKKNIHKLDYIPKYYKEYCSDAKVMLNDFIKRNDIKIILYKGGTIEKNVCTQIGIKSYNIEQFGVPKVTTHCPKEQVILHYKYIKNNCLKEVLELIKNN